jgi:hypothetical protein
MVAKVNRNGSRVDEIKKGLGIGGGRPTGNQTLIFMGINNGKS